MVVKIGSDQLSYTFRRIYGTQLQLAGVSPVAVQKRMRQRDNKLTAKSYFTAGQLGSHGELVKLPNLLSSHIASQNSGHNGQGLSQFVENGITFNGKK